MTDRIIVDRSRLRLPSEPVTFDAKLRFAAQRLERAGMSRPMLGLAAPQIGIRQRLFFYRLNGHDRGDLKATGVVCNPVVVSVSDETSRMYEGCLSLPGARYPVDRPASAVISWNDTKGGDRTSVLDGMACRVWLHEIDHLDGLLAIDRMAPGVEPFRK